MNLSLLPKNIYFSYLIKFFFIFFILNIAFNLIRALFTDQDPFLSAYQDPKTDIPVSWPISVFTLRLPRMFLPIYESYTSLGVNHILQRNPLENSDVLVAIIYLVAFVLFYNYIKKINTPYKIYLVGFFAIILSNSIQGIDDGLIEPLTGEPGDSGRVYHHDAIHINNLLEFIDEYNSLQSNYELAMHSIVHPPGPVITYFFLHTIFSNPLISSITLMSISLLIIFYLHKIICHNSSQSTANFVCLFFVFLPSTQIYFLSSIDSLISLFFLGTIYHFVNWIKSRDNLNYYLCLMFLLLCTLMTFTTVILYFILFAYSFSYLDILPQQMKISNRDKTVGKDIFFLFLPAGVIILFLYVIFGYNYIEGFMAVSGYENRHYSSGFLLFDYPLSYFATRLEDIAELIFFLGPIGLVFLYRGLISANHDYDLFFKYGFLCFLLVISTGAFRTGETARALIYFYPLILITISNFIDKSLSLTITDQKNILCVTFIQVLLMQLFGWYYW